MDEDEKRDEEQEVRDEDADTRDEEENTDEATSSEEEQTADDTSEINRKLDALIESVGLISKAIAQLSADTGSSDGFTQGDESAQPAPVPDFDEMDLTV